MRPGRIGAEFFMTRGHIHARADRPEVYYGQKGVGVMLMESPQGETRVVEIGPQIICYVPPYWIHRSVNTGEEDLVMMFTYPADSGQDYEIIERSRGMRHRVVADGAKGWALIDNRDYAPRPRETVRQLLGHPARVS
jgi:glucose-6-phosphate isomerase